MGHIQDIAPSVNSPHNENDFCLRADARISTLIGDLIEVLKVTCSPSKSTVPLAKRVFSDVKYSLRCVSGLCHCAPIERVIIGLCEGPNPSLSLPGVSSSSATVCCAIARGCRGHVGMMAVPPAICFV